MVLAPKAVIFDLDGCLVDSEPLSIGAIAEESRALGDKDATFEDIRDRFLGVSMSTICQHVALRTGKPCGQGFIDRVEFRVFADYDDKLHRFDGVTKMLDVLKGNNIAMAIATGASLRRMAQTVQKGGLGKWFAETAFSADLVAQGKPAPDIFLYAAKAIGVDPKDCVVVEDSPHGIKGAIEAGMGAIGFSGGTHLDGIRAEHTQLLLSQGASIVATDIEGLLSAILSPDQRSSRNTLKSEEP